MGNIDKLIKKLKSDKRMIGEIIDDRSMNSIPFGAYTKQYKELERLIEILDAERDGRCVVLPKTTIEKL
jgi:hypothetical protein